MAASLLESPFLSNRQLFSTTHHSFQPQKPIPMYYCVPFSRSSSACPLRLCAVGENVDSLALPPLAKVVAEDSVQDNRVSLERSKDRRKVVKLAWEKLVRWSRYWRSKAKTDVLERTKKVVVLGGGSFGTAIAAHVAHRKAELEINMLVRDPEVCRSINESHCNCKYFPEHKLPENVIATTDAKAALLCADFCFHAVPVQFSSSFLKGIADYVDPGLPFISLSKAMVVASKDKKMANSVQQLLASRNMRINTSSDVTGVEIAGALKNVLAIAAGIVEGLNLGNNSMAALVAQGCSEIRWLGTKMGAKSTTLTGLSGTGDIMLTCFVNLSRNRTVGVRLGSGEKLDDILNSMNQVAEGVSTAGAVITLAQKYKVKMPVLTAVARIIDNELTPAKAVYELMNLPQVEEV
ncbi:glycerol-3-phosphate dehydrogenase [NAD(+)] 2, chloroplastic isoform X2 [Olea europaea var. sylvestris]|uniref:glycerol-3-phosphate dehydrogenase [NAD(+)] 2, chloroplastic isoform X2 n=1 Tax=Olea europaea var. sylvestris TaxID=158386 RepID=UPI000C1D24BE|nr:glycerol-3-phosphate dehydrogenase [NAD(+)] 2, chloroplastic isoform X2 [Olea europaea var. sylvestris]